MIFNEIIKALGYLFIAAIVYYAYQTASKYKGSMNDLLFKGLLWCVGIAFFASMMLGNASCESGSDPIYGGCEQYADDGFNPTTEQRTAKFFYYMTLLYVPVVIGAFKKDDKKE